MLPQNVQLPGQTERAQSNALISSTTAIIKSWKTENDIIRDFPQLSKNLDLLCRQGNGRDLLKLYNSVAAKVYDFEVTLSSLAFHVTIWQQVATVQPVRTEQKTLAALFLALPGFEKISDNVRPFSNEGHMKLVEDVLGEASESGAKFVAISSDIKKRWIKTWFVDISVDDKERLDFFDRLHAQYTKPASMWMQRTPVEMPKPDDIKTSESIPVKKR